jgi:hypothetical protein
LRVIGSPSSPEVSASCRLARASNPIPRKDFRVLSSTMPVERNASSVENCRV